jgi:hypothetical protein
MPRVYLLFVFIGLVCISCERAATQSTGWPGETKQHELNAPTKFLVSQAIAQGRKELPVVVASEKSKTAEVEQLIRQAGGQILTSIPEIGYIHAVLPVDKVWWLIAQTPVTDLAVAGGYNFRDDLRWAVMEDPSASSNSRGKAGVHEQAIWSASHDWQFAGNVDLSLPLLSPEAFRTTPGLSANSYLQQPLWLKAHPSWDGRGITIVSAEDTPGVDHPALQAAKDIHGNPVPKIGGIIDAYDYVHPNPADYLEENAPESNDAAAHEIDFAANASLKGGGTCPKPDVKGAKVGVLQVYHYYIHDEYCVEWDARDKAAYVDLNRNGTFGDDPPLRDFNHTRSFIKIPYVATKNDGRANHYFTATLSYDDATETVLIVGSDGDHSAMTATAAAGTGYLGTDAGGMAPGARLMFMRGAVRASTIVEGAWKALSRPDTDLITASTSIGGDTFPSVARTTGMLFYDRIAQVTGKPVIAATGNAGTPFEEGDSRSRLTIDVGGYISRDQLQVFRYNNQPLATQSPDYVFDGLGGSSSGPAADGGLSTDILTPEAGIAGADCGSDHYTGRPSSDQIGLSYRLPPCYAISDGTSAATPRAAGAVALLLSAAKQQHLKVTPEQVKTALIVSARFLPNEPAFRQGPGLLQVVDAWNALKEAVLNPPVRVVSTTHDLSPLYPQYWRGPLIGQGIYVTRGFHPGMRKGVSLDLSVGGISTSALSFDLLGNDGTFTIASTHIVRPGEIRLFIDALAKSTGNKSALVEVRAKDRKYPLARIPILLAATPSPEKLLTGVTVTGRLELPSSHLFLFEPPAGAVALEIVVTAHGSPLGVGFTANSVITNTNPALTYDLDHGHLRTEGPLINERRRFVIPLLHLDSVGMTIENQHVGKEPCCRTDYDFTVRALTASELTASVTRNSPLLVVTRKERIKAEVIPGTLAREANVTVPAGADAVVISFPQIAFDPARPYATEAYLFDPPGNGQGLWNHYPVIDGKTHLSVPKPRAGIWKLVLLGSRSGYDVGPIDVEFLRYTTASVNPPVERYLAFGALCTGSECFTTWPLDNPLWRFMPLFPIPDRP